LISITVDRYNFFKSNIWAWLGKTKLEVSEVYVFLETSEQPSQRIEKSLDNLYEVYMDLEETTSVLPFSARPTMVIKVAVPGKSWTAWASSFISL
jgi:hypothetical protein